ncbi:D111/G-patch domain-containing protein isoform X1 [Carex rostrata]
MAASPQQQQQEGRRRPRPRPSSSMPASDESVFVWDSASGLYYHASTGFYHDPAAGWYYSTRDACYYAFQNNTYVLLDQMNQPQGDNSHSIATAIEEDCASCHESQQNHYSRPSEWLDEILINEYLSGYRNAGGGTSDDHFGDSYSQTHTHYGGESEMDDKPSEEMLGESVSGKQENDTATQNASGTEGMLSAEEESWMAQYGQVDRSDSDEGIINTVDLWDWELLEETSHKGHHSKITRLMGRLVGQSSSLHPSLPSSGGTVKTTAICQVHLDLVLVASGKVYRLRTPSKRYLATLSEYDSSNPTKGWGFPLLSPHSLSHIEQACNVDIFPRSSQNKEEKGEYKNSYRYRDRAAERRHLHGANGIAPCQKDGYSKDMGCASDDDPTIAQEEARVLSFGTQSYASKIMESMGWKQGEALGSSRKGMLEPVEAKGNIGTAGLGWK